VAADPTPSYETLDWAVDDGILTLTLSRPEQLNAFTVTMAEELVSAFGRASTDDDVRAVVVTGSGRAFCAGMDLSVGGNVFGLDESLQPTMADLTERLEDPEILAGVRDTGGRVTLAIYDCTKPVIGALNGAAVGIGATMTLAMDARLASSRARIGFVFGKLGIVPEACSSWFLPRAVGISQAMEWVATGRVFDAAEAERGRLVRSVHAPGELLAAANELAREIADNAAPVSVALTRQMFWRMLGADHPMAAHQLDSRAVQARGVSGDAREGVTAFLEKRPARFPDRVSADLPDFFPWWADRPFTPLVPPTP